MLLDENGHIIAKRAPTHFGFPGGGIDPGEEPRAALLREISEETGLDVDDITPHGRVQWDWPEEWPKNDKQRLRYNQFRGEDSHIFTGRVKGRGKATSKEGDAWPAVVGVPIADLEKAYAVDHGDFAPYKKAQLAAIQALKQGGLKKVAAISLDIEKGDVLLGGRFKNHPIVVDEIGTDELGQPTVNGRKLLAYRIKKALPVEKQAALRINLGSFGKLRGLAGKLWPPLGKTPAQKALRNLPVPAGRDAEEILDALRRQKIKLYRPWDLAGHDAAARQSGIARSVDELEGGGFHRAPGM
jgi:8-oxo-dGTP pyrophosphatase MutT (NUDIX family)